MIGTDSILGPQVHTQMFAADVDFAIVTSYEHTLFLVRDQTNKSVVYASDFYEVDDPQLLYYSTFLAMAAGILRNSRPCVSGEVLRENLDRIATEIASKHNEAVWGILGR